MTALNGPIRPKRSTVAGEVPQASDLVVGEVAINTADGKLFTKHADETVKEISGGGGEGGAVDSVNGKTGVVFLGIQDMDDFSLRADDGLDVGTYNTSVSDSNDLYNTPGGASITFGTTTLPLGYLPRFSQLGADGVDRRTEFETINGSPVWVSVNGLPFVQTVGNWQTLFNGYLEVALDGTGAAPDGTVINEIKVTTVEPGTPQPLEDGDYLRWNANSELFLPAQLATVASTGSYDDLTDQPAIPGEAPVDSVNGKTGVVSLSTQDLSDVRFDVISSALAYRKGNADNPGEYDQRVPNKTFLYLNQYDANGVNINDLLPAGSYDVYVSKDQGATWVANAGGGESGYTSVQLDGGQRWLLLGLTAGNSWDPAGSSTELSGDILVSTSTDVTITTLLPDEGDVLRWDDVEEKFRPAPLATVASTGSYNDLADTPVIPGDAPVDSVNGETGAVSLGIQDMDDFSLLADDGLDVGTYDTYVNTVSNLYSTPGGTTINVGSDTFPLGYAANFGQLGADGVDRRASFETLDIGPVWVSINGLPFVQTTGQWTNDFNGYLRVIIDGTGAAPDGTIMNEVRVTAVQPGTPQPLEEGDYLRWDANSQQFLPAQLPSAPVDSVNGETGAVSLGIQDMDDFSLYLNPNTYIFEFSSHSTASGSPYCSDGVLWHSQYNNDRIYFKSDKNGFAANDAANAAIAANGGNNEGVEFWIKQGDDAEWQYRKGRVDTNAGNCSATSITFIGSFGTPSLPITGAIPTYVTFSDPVNDPYLPLQNEQVLRWNSSSSEWRPEDLAVVAKTGSYNDLTDKPVIPGGGIEEAPEDGTPYARQDAGWVSVSSGGGGVDSVNGETGDVSLGIQDMDDFQLKPAPELAYGRWVNVALNGNNFYSPGDAAIFFGNGGARCIVNHTDSDGKDFGAISAAIDTDNDGQVSNFTFYVSRDGGANWTTHVASSIGVNSSGISTFFSGISPELDATADELRVSYDDPSLPPVPLAEGDVLQWDSTYDEFRPAQFATVASTGSYNDLTDTPTIPAEAPVDSVNGETGVVSLGIQDMDDFQLNPAPALTYGSWATVTLSDSADYFYSGNAVIFGGGGGASCRVNHTDSDGKDFEAISAEAGQIDGYGELENFTFYASRDGGVSWTTHVAASAILDYGGAATAFDGISPELDATTDELRVSYDDPSLPPVPLVEGDVLQWNSSYSEFRPAQLATVASTGSYNDLTDAPVIPGDAPVDSVNGETGVISLGIQDMDDFELNQPAGGDGTWLYQYWSSSGAPSGQFYRNGTIAYLVSYTDSDGANRRDELLGIQVGDAISFFNISNPAETTTGSVTGLTGDDFKGRVMISTNINSSFFTDGETYAFSSPALGNARTPLANSDVLQWDATSQRFKPAQLTIDSNADVNTSTTPPTDGQVLTWVDASNQWEPADAAGSGGGRSIATVTTSSLASGASEDVTLAGTGKAGQFMTVTTDRPAWVVFYVDEASRTADASRTETTSPSPGSGVLMEVITAAAETVVISPVVGYFNNESPPVASLPLKVTNKDASAQAIQVDVKLLSTED